jgi:polyisoprenoid-binding protein YceI
VLKPMLSFIVVVTSLAAQDVAIDVQRSTISIHVGKTGLFSAAGHEHWVDAPIASGTIGESPAPHVEFTVETAKMRVRPDPQVDAKTQVQIQKDMEDMTLETGKFKEISFRSSRADMGPADQWNVEGMLTLHGVTKPLKLIVKRNGAAYASHVILKQTDFGIKPVSVGGGLVKVKNEVEIDFQIFRAH